MASKFEEVLSQAGRPLRAFAWLFFVFAAAALVAQVDLTADLDPRRRPVNARWLWSEVPLRGMARVVVRGARCEVPKRPRGSGETSWKPGLGRARELWEQSLNSPDDPGRKLRFTSVSKFNFMKLIWKFI